MFPITSEFQFAGVQHGTLIIWFENQTEVSVETTFKTAREFLSCREVEFYPKWINSNGLAQIELVADGTSICVDVSAYTFFGLMELISQEEE